jgi:tetratricopeptide (TPR) repeat protein
MSEAIEILKLNVEAFPKAVNVLGSLANAYKDAGERELAIQTYERVLQLDPGHRSALETLKVLRQQ